ncbi:MAG: iron transporter permease [Acidimicrobiales bacterium]|nr:iron transporter permease [Acidimicrobiales bacterium]
MDQDRPALSAGHRSRHPAWLAVAAVPVVFLVVFFAYPVGSILGRGLTDGSVLDVVRRRSVGRLLWFTLWQAAASTVLTLVAGLPAAWAVARLDLPGRRLLRALLLVPFVLPTLVVGAALQATFERFGLDGSGGGLRLSGTVWAILLAHTVFNVAVVIRIVGGYWALLDPRVEEAARVLGAGRIQVVREVVVPRLAPALWSAAGIVFLFCFTSFGVILTVGGPGHPTVETEIWRYATQRTDFTTATALALVQLATVVTLVLVVNRLEARTSSTAAARRPVAPRPVRSRREAVGAAAALGPALALVTVPLAVLVERSLSVGGGHGLGHYRALGRTTDNGLFVSPSTAIANSLLYAAAAMVLAVAVGGLASLVVVHGGRRRGRALDLALMVPLGTSAVTVGFGILLALDEPPLDLRSSRLVVPVAQALVGIPFVVRSLVPALRAVDPRQREAAAVLGASPWRARLAVDAPVVARTLLVGAAFAFAISLGEFGATSFLARPDAPTVPVAMFRLLGQPGAALRGQAMALGTVLAALTSASVLVIERLRPRDALGW